MKKFGRRTVLQLNEKKAEKKPEKPIGLSGLVQYGNDNSESEEEEGSEVSVTPTQMPSSPAEQNGQGDQPPVEVKQAPVEANQAPVEKKDHMDTQLADFLAEIESISKDETESEEAEGSTSHVETAAADSTSATPHTSKQITPATSSGESETDEEEEPVPDVEKPKEPKSAWQHCLDAGTEHYYYWNTVTNQVTWEIPEDYSKYLLLLKEYEERLAKYEKVMKEWKERKNQPKEKKKKRKGLTNGAASPTENEERPKPLVDYKIETPEVKPNVELVTNKYGRGLGFSPDEGQVTPYAPRHRATYPVSFVKGGTVTNKLPELIPKVSKSESSGSQSRNVGKSDRSSPAPVIPPPSEATGKDFNKSDNEEEMSDQENEPVQGPQLPTVQGPQLPTFPSASRSSEPTCNGKEKDAQVESKQESDMEVEDFDLDDIDRQLELALEKKMDGKSKKKRRLDDGSQEDADATKKKRTNDACLPAGPLQPRPPAQPPADKVNKKKIVQEDIKLRAEVDEFARDISDKLDSLEVSRKSMTQLQILLIETETRISDWRDGGIESGFMLKKLQDAGKQLKRYESTAAPPGWSCHWDRTYKRYYYFHNTTGESSWEYPEDEGKDNVTSSQVPVPPSHHPGQHLRHSTVQAPPPPSTTSINRDQPIHFAGLTAAPPPPPPSHPAPPSAAPFPDSTAPAPSPYVLPLGLTNPPPPPSSSPPPTPPGTSPPPPDGAPGDTDTHDAQNEATEDDDDGNVISAAPQIRQNIDLNDGQSLDGMPIADAPDADVDDLPTHSTAAPTASSTSQSSASALPELSSSAAGAAKEKKKKKKLGTGLAMKKKGVGNLVQKWQQIQEEVATKQKD